MVRVSIALPDGRVFDVSYQRLALMQAAAETHTDVIFFYKEN